MTAFSFSLFFRTDCDDFQSAAEWRELSQLKQPPQLLCSFPLANLSFSSVVCTFFWIISNINIMGANISFILLFSRCLLQVKLIVLLL